MILTLDSLVVVQVFGLGLVAGTLGGLLGVGGSTVVIPGLTLIFGYNQHLYQAAAMITNVTVCVPAAARHYRAGTMTPAVLRFMLPLALVCVVVGVGLSNLYFFRGVGGGLWLGRVLAVFLVYVIVVNTRQFVGSGRQDRAGCGSSSCDNPLNDTVVANREGDLSEGVLRRTSRRAAGVGAVMGLMAGLLGIGGGAVSVPLQQMVLKLPLRSCIANSSAVICASAALGAVYKNASLFEHGYAWQQSLSLALLLAPSSWLGGHFGAGLTHRLPVRQVRVVFVVLLIVAAIKMAAIV